VNPIGTRDVTAPISRHNRYVTGERDLEPVARWSRSELYRAVRRADDEDRIVVVDYGRSNLYLADRSGVSYTAPRLLGLVADPALRVVDPDRFDPGTGSAEPFRTVVVRPEFDVLIPAFDWGELDDWDPPEPERTAAGAGVPGGVPGA